MADPNQSDLMSLNDMRKVLMFLMGKLSPADLEELDGQLEGNAAPMASDTRFGDAANRVKLLRLGPVARRAARQAHRSAQAHDAAGSRSIEQRFPDLHRLKG